MLSANGRLILEDPLSAKGFASQDGITWTSFNDSVDRDHFPGLGRIRSFNGRFYAHSSDQFFQSADAVNWSRTSLPFPIRDLAWGNGAFLALSESGDGRACTSTDGIHWTSVSTNRTVVFNSIVFGNGLFIAIDKGRIASSADGMSWTVRYEDQNATASNAINGIAFGKGAFVAAGTQGRIWTSTDGTTWTKSTLDTANGDFSNSVFIGDMFFAMKPRSGDLYASGNGSDWIHSDTHLDGVASMAFGNGRYFATNGAGALASTADPAGGWTKRPTAAGNINAVAHSGKAFVAVGSGGVLATSVDGEHWTEQPLDSAWDLNAVAWGDGLAVAVGVGGAIRTSPDLVQWTTRTSGTKGDFSGIAFGDSVFVAATKQGEIFSSPDGISWTRTDTAGAERISYLAFGNGIFLALNSAAQGSLRSSTDGVHWTRRVFNTVSQSFGGFLAHGESGFMFGASGFPGSADTVYTSVDGQSVQPIRVQADYDPSQYFVYPGSMIYAQGYYYGLGPDRRTIIRSTDGRKWSIDSSEINIGSFLFFADGKMLKVGTPYVSMASGTDLLAIAPALSRHPAIPRAMRLPTQGFLVPAYPDRPGTIEEVFDAKGNTVLRRAVPPLEGSHRINPPSAQGAYFLRIKDPAGTESR